MHFEPRSVAEWRPEPENNTSDSSHGSKKHIGLFLRGQRRKARTRKPKAKAKSKAAAKASSTKSTKKGKKKGKDKKKRPSSRRASLWRTLRILKPTSSALGSDLL